MTLSRCGTIWSPVTSLDTWASVRAPSPRNRPGVTMIHTRDLRQIFHCPDPSIFRVGCSVTASAGVLSSSKATWACSLRKALVLSLFHDSLKSSPCFLNMVLDTQSDRHLEPGILASVRSTVFPLSWCPIVYAPQCLHFRLSGFRGLASPLLVV